jgi:hypothetical protein
MTIGDMHNIRDKLLDDLDASIKIKKQRGLELADAEASYRMLLTSMMAKAMIDGLDGMSKPMAATATYDFCRGIPEVAEMRRQRDSKRVLMETVQEHIYAVKSRLRVVEQDIQNELNTLGR